MFEDAIHPQVKRKAANKELIKDWCKNNPQGTRVDCAKGIGLSYSTVVNLVKEMKAEGITNDKA